MVVTNEAPFKGMKIIHEFDNLEVWNILFPKLMKFHWSISKM